MQLTANELTWETGSLGSNPSLSAIDTNSNLFAPHQGAQGFEFLMIHTIRLKTLPSIPIKNPEQ